MNRSFPFLIAAFLLCTASGEELLNRSFQTEESLKDITSKLPGTHSLVTLEDGKKALELRIPETAEQRRNVLFWRGKGKDFQNRNVRFSAELRIDLKAPRKKWDGGQFAIWGARPDGKPGIWEDSQYIGVGKKTWKTYSFECRFPADLQSLQLMIGSNGAIGKVWVRNLKIESEETFLPLGEAANMGFADEVAGDGRGGWHDQGSNMDASRFPVAQQTFANVPFQIVDPKKNDGKSIVVMECPRLPNGPKQIEIPLSVPVSGRYLYLLHCSAWGQENGSVAGWIDVCGGRGGKVEIPVVYGKDLIDWWGEKGAANAVSGTPVAAKGGTGSVYVSRFELPEKVLPVQKVIFRKKADANAMWMLVGATLSEKKYRYPEQKKQVMREDRIWKALPQRIAPVPKAGSALDLSGLFPKHRTGEFGRVVIGKNGQFEFEKRPGIPLRFLSFSMGREFWNHYNGGIELSDKQTIDAFVEQVERSGYNMVRVWANALRDMDWKTLNAFEFSERILDLLDYLAYRLQEKGVYIYLSLSLPTIGFDKCYPWGGPDKLGWSLYRNKRDFDAWCKGTEMLLNHRNPYTKTRYVDDPQIAFLDLNNELEFAFIRADNRFAPLFREFLKKKYKTFSALKAAWKSDAAHLNSFEDIRTFQPLGKDRPGQLNRDRAEFVTEQERGLYERELAFVRKLGYKGPVTTFLLGKSMRHAGVRKEFDFVSSNSYHDHPIGSSANEARISQASSIGNTANTVRSFLSVRPYGKPFVVSEHGHCYWNRYRYEHGFVMGGYAALNGFDVLTGFMMPVTIQENHRIFDFEIRFDPIRRATELMTALLFRRGDVRTAPFSTRIQMNLHDVIQSDAVTDSINASQLQMGLIGRCFVDQTSLPARPQELVMPRIGASATAVRRADSSIVDSASGVFDMDSVLRELKKRHLLPQGNRTQAENEIFESVTGELVLNSRAKRMTIVTDRFQGLCAEAGSKASFPNFSVVSMNRRGCLALASIDGEKDLTNANRLLLFLVTNALNSGTTFEGEDQRVRLTRGGTPILLETGTFRVRIRTKHAEEFKVRALGLDGLPLAELPAKKIPGGLELTIDTAAIPGGPSLYFELSR